MIKYLLVAGAGIGVGYFVAQKKAEQYYLELLAEEAEEIRAFYKEKYEKKASEDQSQPGVTVSKMPIEAAEALKVYRGLDTTPAMTEGIVAEAYHKATTNASEAAHALVEKVARTLPSQKLVTIQTDVITAEEFVAGRDDYEQASLTYFAGDDVLANESDEVIPREKRGAYVSEEILLELKAGSSNSIFLRNHEKKADLDITRSMGKYSDEVVPGLSG